MQFEKKEDATNSIEQKVSDSEFIGKGNQGWLGSGYTNTNLYVRHC